MAVQRRKSSQVTSLRKIKTFKSWKCQSWPRNTTISSDYFNNKPKAKRKDPQLKSTKTGAVSYKVKGNCRKIEEGH